jgi:hypothetical protein
MDFMEASGKWMHPFVSFVLYKAHIISIHIPRHCSVQCSKLGFALQILHGWSLVSDEPKFVTLPATVKAYWCPF